MNADALQDVSRVFHFEYWLRYYFIEEQENGLYLSLTEEQRTHMQAQFPEYWALVEQMQDAALSPELSQKIVGEFIQMYFEGKKYSASILVNVLDSKEFSLEMLIFDTWVSLHENQLMEKIYGFDAWMHIYGEWKDSDQGQRLVQSFKMQIKGESQTIN